LAFPCKGCLILYSPFHGKRYWQEWFPCPCLLVSNVPCREYQQLRLVIHELAFKAKEIYEAALIDEKKLLFAQLFTNFTQNRYEITPNYNLAAEYLLEWIPKLNESYEQQKSLMIKGLNAEMLFDISRLLRTWDDVRIILRS
jgi:hypothetical protein